MEEVLAASSVNDVRGGAAVESESRPGTATVVDGRIVVTDPVGQGSPAVLVPVAGIRVSINGKAITEATPVRAEDYIEVRGDEDETPPDIRVDVSSDKMTAAVAMTPLRRICRKAANQPPATQLRLTLTEEKSDEWALGADEVKAALDKKLVKAGIDEAAITALVTARDEQTYVVARGTPAIEGTNGMVEVRFPTNPVKIAPTEEDGRIDYRERVKLPTVHEGDVLAVLHMPVPGKPGQKVTGEAIQPKPVKEAVLRVGEGAKLSKDGKQALAANGGIPVAEGSEMNMAVRVNKILDHSGDVNLSSGNLRFDGEIVIHGNIEPGMTVIATGAVTIQGMVDRAVIEGGKGVMISGNVIGGKIRAGGSSSALVIQGLLPELERAAIDLEHLLAACRQLAAQNSGQMEDILHNHPGQMIMALFSHSFIHMRDRFCRLTALLKPGGPELPNELAEWLRMCRDKLVGLGPTSLHSIDEVAAIGQNLASVNSILAARVLAPAPITVPYIQNSTLEASGDINITGQGCFYSTLVAGGNVTIARAFRGGNITAKGFVRVAQAGSPHAQSSCVITVDKAGYVDLGEVEPDVIVHVGNRSHQFEKTRTNVRVKLDSDGEIQA